MSEPKLLLIDDDTTLLDLLSDHLRTAGYRVFAVPSGLEGMRQLGIVEPDLVLLDVMMPGMDGWEVCLQVRERLTVPIIMLTAKGEEVDKLRGFRLGVDDYVTKPFSFAELTARIGAVLSRARQRRRDHNRITSGELVVDLDGRNVTLGTRAVDLTPTEYRLLSLLASNAGRAIPNELMLEEVWGPEYAGEVKHIKHFIWSLRQKIETDPGDPEHILTERGFGYRFE